MIDTLLFRRYYRTAVPAAAIGSMLLVVVFSSIIPIYAQEIDFGSYSNKYSISVFELNAAEDLSFGTIIQNEGLVQVELSEAKVLEIEGVKYLDVMVDIIADEYLVPSDNPTCDVNECGIPFTLQAAYANRGENNVSHAQLLNNTGTNMLSAYFPILSQNNQPPGPPPSPDYEGYDPTQFHETAYLYLYGSISVGNVSAGSYSASITITINYD